MSRTPAVARPSVDVEGYILPGTEEASLFERLDLARLPRHLAVIMDGNGRWARQRKLARVRGHEAGTEAVREVVECSARLRLEVLTLYAFSQENWKRPKAEIAALMALLKRYLRSEMPLLMRHNIRFQPIGQIQRLDASVQRALDEVIEATRQNTGMIFQVALSYGGRAEIVEACRKLVSEASARGRPPEISEESLSASLYTAGRPDPDLLIRTSGELRVSNFLLWQIAYSEIWVSDILWPDFRRRHLLRALVDFQKRERRYGALK